ncbi:MAG: fibronectin type III domain-containing protein [Bacteroidales bacterium]|nr:fibronectin type III domain-containing protein [Bacteroidales bacterium]
MRKFYNFLMPLVAIVALALPTGVRAQSGNEISTFPWSCDFETASDNAVWTFSNASNGWYIGTATNNGGTHAMYVSENSGSTSSYSGSACVSYAYVTLDIASAGQYALQFDWKCNGESTYDFLRVAVASATTALPTSYSDWTSTSVPSNFMAVDGGSKLNLQTAWQTYSTEVAVPAAGLYRLIFVWRNDGSVYYQPPAAIDNVVVTELTCPRPTALTAIPSADHLDISWTAGGSETEWMVVVDDSIVDYAYTNSYTAINLQGNTVYNVKVYAICGPGDTSLATLDNFRTSCVAISTLPYQNDFEQDPHYSGTPYADAFPSCWTRINDATGTYNYYPYLYASSTYAHSGATGMYWYFSTSTTYANNEYAVLPPIDTTVIDMTDLTLVYYAKTTSTSYHPQMIVGVMTDPTDQSTFTPVLDFGPNATTTEWQMFATSFANYTGYGNYIAIKVPRPSSTAYLAIDDIFLTDDWCNSPMNVQSLATTDAVTLSWNPNGGSSFTVVLGTDTITGVTDTFYTFNGLTASTQYNYAVATECTSSLSFWVTGTAHTACEAIATLPYFQNFDGLAGSTATSSIPDGFLPPCWDRYNDGTRTSYQFAPYVYNSSTYSHSGSNCIRFYVYTTSGDSTQYLILPEVDSATYPINTMQLSFWLRGNSTSSTYRSDVIVGVMTNPTVESSFIPYDTILSAGTAYNYHEINFDRYSGPQGRITMMFPKPTASSSYEYGYVDDVKLDLIPACPPINSHSVVATAGAARLTWEAGIEYSGYTVNYALDSVGATTSVSVTSPTVTLTGLTADTTYYVTILPACSAGEVPYTFTFNTQALPCGEWDTTGYGGPTDTISIGTHGTSTTNVMPVNQSYNYSYCQHLFLASQIPHTGPITFSGFAFQYASTQLMTNATNCSVYFANTTRADMMGTDSTFVPYSQLQLVYVGPLNCTTQGWNYFNFNQGLFTYDGVSNMVVAIVDNSGSSDGTSCNFYYETTSGSAFTHRVFGSTPYDSTEMDAARAGQSYWRSNMKLLTGGGSCISQASCYPPYVTARFDAAGDVQLDWLPGYQETSWDVDYKASTASSWTNVLTGTTAMTATIPVNTLLPNTQYNFRVTANCSDTTLSGSASLTTPCGAIAAVPYTEDFESASTGSSTSTTFVNCWTRINNGTSYYGYPYVGGSTYNHTTGGAKGLYWYNSITTGTYGDYQYIVLPPLDVTLYPINTLQLTFWAKASSPTYSPVFEVGVMRSPDSIASFQLLGTVNVGNSALWDEYSTVLNSYTGTGRYVAIRALRPTSSWYAYVDDITLEPIPTCPHVGDITVDMTTYDSIQISWIPVGNESQWQVSSDGTTWTSCNDSTYTFTGLSASTQYTLYVRPVCGVGDTGNSRTVTARTTCANATLPYVENFDTYTTSTTAATGVTANCWDAILTGTATYQTGSYVPQVYYSSSNAHSGNYSYRLYGIGYHMLPPMPTSLDSLELTFWDYTTSTSYGLEVGVMEGTNFVPVQVINTPTSTHMQHTVYFSTYTGTSRVIAFRNWYTTSTTTYYSYHYLDDVHVHYIPTCAPVMAMTVDTATIGSITIDWTDVTTAVQYQIEYGPAGFTRGSGTIGTATSHPFTATGLSSSMAYDFYVRPICSIGDTGEWSDALTAYTECATTVLPYSQNFDATPATTYSTEGVLPPCWQGYSNGTSAAYNPHVVGSGSYWYADSANSLVMTSGSATYGDVKMVRLPLFDQPINTLTMSFWMSTESSTNGYLCVGYMTGQNFETDFVTVDSIHASSTTYHGSSSGVDANSYRDTVVFSGAPANAMYIAFKWVYTTSFYSCCIDDIEVTSTNAGCPTPVISSVTNDYASATINVAGNDLGYELTYGTDPSNLGNPMTSTIGIFTIAGLTPATQYFFAVTQLCDSGVVSSPAMGTFTTDSLPCFEPSNVAVVNTTFNSAEIGWTSMGNATSWVISITAAGETRYDTVVTNPYTITGLYADQAYTVMVMALCGGGAAQSAWSEPYTFTTDPCTRVSGVTVTDITATSARVSWNAVQGSAGYRLYYGAPEFYEEEATQVEIASSATSYVINGLNPQTNYELYVRNRCTETLYSDVTTEDRVPFTTLNSSEGIYDVESGTLTLYPNPASEKVTMTVTGFEGTVEVEIVDMNGRRVANYTTMDSELTINVNDLSQGAYFVRVTGDTHTAVRKLIVK